mgnify:CR=1 FL=1
MITLMNLPIRRGNAPLRIARGHFATNHSHINYYVDITYQKPRLSEALKLDRVFRQSVSFHKSSLFTARNAAVRRTAFADADFYFIIFFCRRSAASFVSAAHGMRKRAYRRAGYLNPSGGSQRRRRVRDIIFRAARAAVRRLRRYRSVFRMR